MTTHPSSTESGKVPAADTLQIRMGSAQEAWAMAMRIGEEGGDADRYGREVYEQRLEGPSAMVLLAEHNGEPIAFKAGYDRFQDGSWYAWMGGVLRPWHGQGVTQRLLEAQEDWVQRQGYRELFVKTRNRHKRMIAFLASNGYDAVRVEVKSAIQESRILFSKRLSTVTDTTQR